MYLSFLIKSSSNSLLISSLTSLISNSSSLSSLLNSIELDPNKVFSNSSSKVPYALFLIASIEDSVTLFSTLLLLTSLLDTISSL